MAERWFLRQMCRRLRSNTAAWRVEKISATATHTQHYLCTSAAVSDGDKLDDGRNSGKQWLILPPFVPTIDGSLIGKKLSGKPSDKSEEATSSMTALKWTLKCCPHLPRSLLQKLFRLRQVRKECSSFETEERRPKRVGAKELMGIGERIFLPKSVDERCPSPAMEKQSHNQKELNFIRSLELYKDPAIIAICKPPGMPVQGGLGIKRSLDELASKYLKYDLTDSPRLVHRLDRDSSGILVMGRTQLSASVLHSIFREKTCGASNEVHDSEKILQKRYWALVIGSPRRREGVITMPLAKVVVDNGKSERITVVNNAHTSAQHAVTEYRVITSSSSGYTWLELSPLTGRKHQLRVHCAEVLGTPIVGDYKYGWHAHKKMDNLLGSASDLKSADKMYTAKQDAFGLERDNGNVFDRHRLLHLHCKVMVLPNISLILQHGKTIPDLNTAQMESIKLDAPLPLHMQRSWDLLNA